MNPFITLVDVFQRTLARITNALIVAGKEDSKYEIESMAFGSGVIFHTHVYDSSGFGSRRLHRKQELSKSWNEEDCRSKSLQLHKDWQI